MFNQSVHRRLVPSELSSSFGTALLPRGRSGVVDPEAVRKLHGELEQRRLELDQARADLERFSESELSARDIKLRKAGLDAIEATSDAIDLMEGGLIGLL